MAYHYQYLIVGGGMTASAAVDGIRQVDKAGRIGVIGMEEHLPYDRPPLSKALWTGRKTPEKIWRKTNQPGVDWIVGRQVMFIDPPKKVVHDHMQTSYTYDRLLLATGANPRKLPIDGGADVIYFRTFDDYQHLRLLTATGKKFAVIGGGFIGSEIAAALTMNGEKVTLLFQGAGIGDRVFPRDLSLYLNDYYRRKGVEILPNTSVKMVEEGHERLGLHLENGHTLHADGVIAGLGVRPATELAASAGLAVGNGILVDEYLRTNARDVYAAGDVASFYNPALDRRILVEHEDNALTMGLIAGKNMAGEPIPYHHLPYFYSDLFEMGYEAVGDLDTRYETVEDWQEPYQKGVVYYLDKDRVVGVLLWNVWAQVDAARQLIAEPGPFKAEDLKMRLPSRA